MQVSDFEVEQIIGKLLRAGVLLAAFVVLVGGVLFLAKNAHERHNYRQFHGVSASLKSIPGVVSGAAHLDPESVIQLGLLLLIATPVARVAFSIGAFALEKDYLYVVLTMVVLGVLLFSLMQSA
ncbi:MAG TPA: DUF1634 domain-containing protein [Candidatus Koribacter sp.]|jgi:uncharacterized membrane protein